ncbi:MAG: hypothetical protein OXC40_05525 [Proteobacteria bacterium]|nr:hypothetical protein [Pseudomonadota bacterium]
MKHTYTEADGPRLSTVSKRLKVIPTKQLICLTGMPGVGKTTYGKEVARILGLGFADLDHMMAREGGTKITSVSSTTDDQVARGDDDDISESSFRACESQILTSALKAINHVIALGGGTLTGLENREQIARSGALLIWLDQDPGMLINRIKSSPQGFQGFIRHHPYFRDVFNRCITRLSHSHETRDEAEISEQAFAEAYHEVYSERKDEYQNSHFRCVLDYMSDDLIIAELAKIIKAAWLKARSSYG